MNLDGKTTVITGAAKGIGAALANRFAQEGANIVLADTDSARLELVAQAVGGLPVACDVTIENDIQNVVSAAEDRYGPVDLFCSNAGLIMDEPDHAASSSNEAWHLCWQIHVMAHVYAARAVLPSMIERGQGYLLNMCSAAGLLNQIGNAAYSTTKHAAVGFAESLAITHQQQGIKVSVICPQYVATPLLGYRDDDAVELPAGTITPDVVAESVVEGIRQEKFLILPHPEIAKYIQFKSADYDKWLRSMVKLREKVANELGSVDVKEIHKLV